LFVFGWCFLLAIIGSYLTITIGPGSTGSGIAEIMAILNGINYPGFISVGVLFCKCFCVILGICASLCIGKEGPLAHIGACVAYFIIYYVPIKKFDYFKNEVSKREFLAGGASAGVSAAFGAPIGGALFSYELSRPATFWTFSMLWRIFFCCSTSTFTLSILSQIADDGWSDLKITSAGTLKFGDL
jgi:chloride channel 7